MMAFVSHQENMNWYNICMPHFNLENVLFVSLLYSLYRNGNGCSCNTIVAFLITLQYAIMITCGCKANMLYFSPMEREKPVIN